MSYAADGMNKDSGIAFAKLCKEYAGQPEVNEGPNAAAPDGKNLSGTAVSLCWGSHHH